ncbi:MAG: hypothetical protein J5934_00530 [Succinivibrio sp.]|nr:hypothetical protein [Succinivibrio sp.]
MSIMADNGNRAVKGPLYDGALSIYHQEKISGEPSSDCIDCKGGLNKGAFKEVMIAIAS